MKNEQFVKSFMVAVGNDVVLPAKEVLHQETGESAPF